MRNALLPVVTIIGLNFGLLVSGAVLTETIFGLTGVGRTLVDGITARDYTLVQGFTVVIAVSFVVINLVVDIALRVSRPAYSAELSMAFMATQNPSNCEKAANTSEIRRAVCGATRSRTLLRNRRPMSGSS